MQRAAGGAVVDVAHFGMPDAVLRIFLQFMIVRSVGAPLRLPRQQLLQCAYDLLSLRVVVVNVQQEALLQAAVGMLLKFELREADATQRYACRVGRQENRAMAVLDWLPRNLMNIDRIRMVVRHFRIVNTAVVNFIREHPRMRAALMQHSAAAEAAILEDASSSEDGDDEEF
jgi:hypothetical protein